MEGIQNLNPRNPLSIIALFVSFCYLAISCVMSLNITYFSEFERECLVFFICIFPIIIFWAFFILVVGFHNHLYAPKDFRTDTAFYGNVADEIEVDKKKEDEITELNNAGINYSFMVVSEKSDGIYKYNEYESKALRYIERKFSMFLRRDVKIGRFVFDAIGITNGGRNYLIEIKMSFHRDILMKTANNMIVAIQENNQYRDLTPMLVVLSNNNNKLESSIAELKYKYPTLMVQTINSEDFK